MAVDGPLSPADFFHTAAEIGLLLGLVARGMSLRRASQAVRLAAGRSVPDAAGSLWASRECTLAARYVDLFGVTLERALAPDHWPAILVFDAKPFGLRAYGAAEHGEAWDPGRTGRQRPHRRRRRRSRPAGAPGGSAWPATRRPRPGRTLAELPRSRPGS